MVINTHDTVLIILEKNDKTYKPMNKIGFYIHRRIFVLNSGSEINTFFRYHSLSDQLA